MLILLFLFSVSEFKPFVAHFSRTTTDSKKIEVVKGNVYFIAPWRIYYEVNFPISQMISLVKNTTTIYYPEQKKALRITSNNSFSSPMDQLFFSIEKQSEMMKTLNLKLDNMEKRGDTIFSVLLPINKKKSSIRKMILGSVKQIFVYSETIGKNDKYIKKVFLANHILIDDISIPTEVVSQQWINSEYKEEQTNYGNVSSCLTVVDSLDKFQIPNGVEIKEIKW